MKKNLAQIFIFLFTLQVFAKAELPMPQAPDAMRTEKKDEWKRDPLLQQIGKRRHADKEFNDAVKRSGKKGVITAESAHKDHIYEIQIEGAKKIEPEALLLNLSTQLGDELDSDKIDNDISTLLDMGLFLEVTAYADKGPNGSIILIFEIKEKPTIHKIKIYGNDEVKEDDIKEAISLRSYYVADIPRIIENIEKIKNLYKEKGFFLAEVDYKLVPVSADNVEEPEKESSSRQFATALEKQKVYAPDFVDVVFTIKEKKKIRVEKINFIGNKQISADKIREVMQTKSNHPLSMVTKWGVYNEDMFEIDVALIEKLYQDEGFLNVKIGKPRVALSADKTRVTITIPIEEGSSYRIGTVDIKGDFIEENKEYFSSQKKLSPEKTLFLKSDLLKKFSLSDGDKFNRTQVAKDLMAITEKYKDEGYAYVNATPLTQIHEEEKIVDIVLDMQAGPQVSIERIEIYGNDKTADEVIRREFRIYEGELYSSSLLRLSERRINQLGYFEAVTITTRAGTDENKIIVEVNLKEKSSGSIQAGAGFGTGGEGFIFQGQVAQNNLFGRGQSLSAQVQWSARRRIFDIRFADPYIFYVGEEPMTFAFSLYDSQRNLPNLFSRGATGGDITFGYPIGRPLFKWSRNRFKEVSEQAQYYVPDFENLRLFLTFNLERVKIEDDLETKVFGLHLNEPRYTTSLKPTLQLDQRNNRLFPSRGYFLEAQAEFASEYLGSILLANWENQIAEYYKKDTLESGLWYLNPGASANNFMRFSFNARGYYSFDDWFFIKGVVAKAKIDIGYLYTFGHPLLSENYYMGGMNTVRGFYEQTIGPIERVGRNNPDDPLAEFRTGGNKQFLLNLELEFPIVKALNISGVVFLDAGNVFAANENFFYIGNPPEEHMTRAVFDPRRDLALSMYFSAGFGLRWLTPLGLLRFEWGIPITRRPAGTPGLPTGDGPIAFNFNIGSSF